MYDLINARKSNFISWATWFQIYCLNIERTLLLSSPRFSDIPPSLPFIRFRSSGTFWWRLKVLYLCSKMSIKLRWQLLDSHVRAGGVSTWFVVFFIIFVAFFVVLLKGINIKSSNIILKVALEWPWSGPGFTQEHYLGKPMNHIKYLSLGIIQIFHIFTYIYIQLLTN